MKYTRTHARTHAHKQTKTLKAGVTIQIHIYQCIAQLFSFLLRMHKHKWHATLYAELAH